MGNTKKKSKISKGSVLGIAVIITIAIFTTAIYLLKHGKAETQTSNNLVAQKTKQIEQLSSAQCAQKLPVDYLAGQVLMLGVRTKNLAYDSQLFKKYNIGGAVLMDSPDLQHLDVIKQFKNAGSSSVVPILISTDEEGGQVQRFTILGKLPSPKYVADNMSTIEAENLIEQHGKKLKASGIDMILGPLADVSPKTGIGPVGERAFSSNPEKVAEYDTAYIRGWQNAGLYPTLKHFPGLGSATGNSDFQASVTPPFDQIVKTDLAPYKLIDKNGVAIMIGNQIVPNFTKIPASLSPQVNKYLRDNLGFSENLVVTDSLDAKAITQNYSEAQAAVYALISGNDLVVDTAERGTNITEPFIKSLTNGVINAVENHSLSKQELAQSVARKLSAQGLNACEIKKND